MASPQTGTLYWLPIILSDERLDAAETLLMVSLANHVNAKDECFVGIRTLANAARVSYSTARRRLVTLETKGFIERTRRQRDDGADSVYDFRLLRDPPPSVSAAPCSAGRAGPPAHQGERAEVPRTEKPRKKVAANAAGNVRNLWGSDDEPVPSDPVKAMSKRLADAVYAKKRPRPAGKGAYLGIRKTAEALLESEWEPRQIYEGMMSVATISIRAMEIELRRLYPPTPGGSESRQQVRER